MSLTNFSLPFGALAQPNGPWNPNVSPLHPIHQQLAGNANNLLYSPAEHQQQPNDGAAPPPNSDFYKNNPYAPPQQTSYQYNSNNNGRRQNSYLPPPPGTRNSHFHYQQQQFPQQQQQQQQQQQYQQHQQFSHINHNQPQQQLTQNNNVAYKNPLSSASTSSSSSSSSSLSTSSSSSSSSSVASALTSGTINTRTYGEGSYSRFPQAQPFNTNNNNLHKEQAQQQQQQQFYNTYTSNKNQQQQQQQRPHITAGFPSSSSSQPQPNYGPPPAANVDTPASSYIPAGPAVNKADSSNESSSNDPYPDRPPGFTRVQAGQGARTGVHAVLDYDLDEGEEEDYYDAEDHGEAVAKDGSQSKSPMPTVTPIQGPIYLKNGTVPVVPLFHYPTFNNGSFVQIPIWWTALSVALGLDVSGDLIKGVPCIKRYHQLFCPTAGNSYPIDKIERFIDDNKALMRRMYGDFEMNMDNGGPRQQTKKRKRRFIDDPDLFLPPGAFPSFVADDKVAPHAEEEGETYFGKLRNKRQSNKGNRNTKQAQGQSPTGRLDACESKIEILTPYWASNSAGKIRAVVNTQHFEQAVHQEICTKSQTPRCQNDCGCEQKYKWHRLLAYDPDDDCKGIFMDWFLFPSCCVCRCNP